MVQQAEQNSPFVVVTRFQLILDGIHLPVEASIFGVIVSLYCVVLAECNRRKPLQELFDR
jgi:hypothetical protein